jgi:hypothetical protein
VVTTYDTETRAGEWKRGPGDGEIEDGFSESLRLGSDIRFLLVVIGGGAVRVGSNIARRHLRYVETVAINCDSRIQDSEDFDRRLFLGPEGGAEGGAEGSPLVGGQLARAARSSLQRVFEGATFVTIVASLGGGTGTGALPVVLEAAARSSEVLSLFLIRPFECEGERRAIADRSVAGLSFVPAWVDKQQRGVGSLQVLDNEALARRVPGLMFNRINKQWADQISDHIERAFLTPAEAAVGTARSIPQPENEIVSTHSPLTPPVMPGFPQGPGSTPDLPPIAAAAVVPADAELTFEIELPVPGPSPL